MGEGECQGVRLLREARELYADLYQPLRDTQVNDVPVRTARFAAEKIAEARDGDTHCDSCSGCADSEESFCHGCGMIVCIACVEVFNHIGDGLHGVGNPYEAVQELYTYMDHILGKRPNGTSMSNPSNWSASPVPNSSHLWCVWDAANPERIPVYFGSMENAGLVVDLLKHWPDDIEVAQGFLIQAPQRETGRA